MRSHPLIFLVLAFAGYGVHADPLLRPARTSALVGQRMVTAVTAAGSGLLVAVGQRGHVLRSTDAGATWTQSPMPVSSDLAAVQFPNAQQGFAVGHDGVILSTSDAGNNWTKLLDGKAANALTLTQLKAAPASAERDRLLDEAQRNLEAGPDKPFLDLYFRSPSEGFVVGAYNLIFQTRDGGKSWDSWYERSDNTEKLFNLYAIRAHKGRLFVAGEGGTVMRLDESRNRFVRLDAGYRGSFFGLLDAGEALIAYGMRGNAVISRDAGTTWSALATGLQASITASAKGADGRLWLGDQVGNVSVSRDGGNTFSPVKLTVSMPLAAIHATPSTLVLAGVRGVRGVPLPKE